MLVLPQTVEIELNGNTIKYYEEKGYEIPRRIDIQGRNSLPRGTKIIVNVLDLREQSNTEVLFICDYCGKEYFQKFSKHYLYNNMALYIRIVVVIALFINVKNQIN